MTSPCWEEPEHVARTVGILNVRPHLRPKPLKRDFTWFYNRDEGGLLHIYPIENEAAIEMVVQGEA